MLTKLLGIESRASFENPSVPLSDPRAWEEFLEGGETDSGGFMNELAAIAFAPIWQGMSQISGAIARLPLAPYDISGATRLVDKKHAAYRIVRRKANRERTAFQTWRVALCQAALYNEAFLYILRAGDGTPLELINLRTGTTRQERKAGQLRYYTELAIGDRLQEREVDPSEIFHITGPALDPLNPPPLIRIARNSIGKALAAEKYEASFFKNGNRVGGYLMIPSHFTEKAAEQLQEGFVKKTSGFASWFKTVILREGAKFEKNSFSMQEMLMDKIRELSALDAARWLNLTPSRLGIPGSTAYNSKAEDNREFLDTTLAPWMTSITSEADDKLLTDKQKADDSHEFLHDVTILLRMSLKDQAAVDAIHIRNRQRSPNETRVRDGYEPYEGGDEMLPIPGAPKPGSSDGGADKNPAEGSQGSDGGDSGGDSARSDGKNLKELFDAYSVAVRSGAITPQMTDEEIFRQLGGFPVMSEDVRAAWQTEPFRRPVTLSNAKQELDKAEQVDNPDNPDEPGDEDEQPGDAGNLDAIEETEETEEPDDEDGQDERAVRRRRVIFSLTARARKKAENPNAFVEWIDGGFVQFRRQAAELLGDDAEILQFHKRCLGLADTNSRDALPAAVDRLCTEFEEK